MEMSQLSPVKTRAARQPRRPKPEVEASSGSTSSGTSWKLAGAAALSAAGLLATPAAAQASALATVVQSRTATRSWSAADSVTLSLAWRLFAYVLWRDLFLGERNMAAGSLAFPTARAS